MIKILFYSLMIFSVLKGFSQKVEKPYEIGTWEDFRTSAVSYTFDDNLPYQYSRAIPALDELGYKATFYTVTDWSPNYAMLKTIAGNGHEIGGHTSGHPNLSSLSDSLQTNQLKKSQDLINKNVDNQKCVTIAYPYCAPGNNKITSKYYISARHCQQFIEGKTPIDFMSVSSITCGSQGSVKAIADFKAKINEAVTKKGWLVFLIHELDNGSGYSPLSSAVFKSSLYYCKIRNYKVWVSTFANVSKYIKERNTASVSEIATSDSIVVKVSDTLDNSIYDYPITIRRPLPSGWDAVSISQNSKPVKVSYVKTDTVVYAMFSVVPDAGDVIMKKQLEVIELIDQNFEEEDTVGKTPVIEPSSIKTAGNNSLRLNYINGNLKFELPTGSNNNVSISIYNSVGVMLVSNISSSVVNGKGNICLTENKIKAGLCIVNIKDTKSSWSNTIVIN